MTPVRAGGPRPTVGGVPHVELALPLRRRPLDTAQRPAPPRPVPGLPGVARRREGIAAAQTGHGRRSERSDRSPASGTLSPRPPPFSVGPSPAPAAPPPTRVHRPRFPPPHTCRGMASRPRSSTRRCADAPPPRPGGGEGRRGRVSGAAARTVGEGTARREREEREGRTHEGLRRREGEGRRPSPAPQRVPHHRHPLRGAGALSLGSGCADPRAGPCRCGGAPLLQEKGRDRPFPLWVPLVQGNSSSPVELGMLRCTG